MRIGKMKRLLKGALDHGFTIGGIEKRLLPRKWYRPWEKQDYQVTLFHSVFFREGVLIKVWGDWRRARGGIIRPPTPCCSEWGIET